MRFRVSMIAGLSLAILGQTSGEAGRKPARSSHSIRRVGDVRRNPSWIAYYSGWGAETWRRITKGDTLRDSKLVKTTASIVNTLKKERVSIVVSLGSGDGERDQRTVLNLKRANSDVVYVAVDGSPELLTRLSTPPGSLKIQGNFEADLPDIIQEARERQPHGPMVVSFIGYTFGNLRKTESDFLLGLKSSLKSGDFVLFDYLAFQGRFDAKGYKADVLRSYPRLFREFFAPEQSKKWTSGDEFAENVFFEEGAPTDVPGSQAFNIATGEGAHKKILWHLKRYESEIFGEWLKTLGFDVAEHRFGSEGDAFEEFGVTLLKIR